MAELSSDLAAAIDGVVLAIPQLKWVLGGDPPATMKEAFKRYPTPSEDRKIIAVWMAWHAATYLRDVRDGNALGQGVTEEVLRGAYHALRSYQYGNGSPDLAEEMADLIAHTFPGATTWHKHEPDPRCA